MVERKSSIIAWGAEDIPGTRRQKTSYTVRSLLPISKKFHKVDTLGSLPPQSLILSLHLSSISHFCHPTDYLFTSYTIYTGSSQKFFFLLSVNLFTLFTWGTYYCCCYYCDPLIITYSEFIWFIYLIDMNVPTDVEQKNSAYFSIKGRLNTDTSP